MIVLDTSVLIAAFRHRGRADMPDEVALLRRLIREDAPLAIPGIACQELLAGAANDQQFERLARLIEGFPVLLADRELNHRAARVAAACRRAGVAVATADSLIAAHAIAVGGTLFTLDRDFAHMAECCGLMLHPWR